MELKAYQKATLAALDRFLTRAPATGPEAAFIHEVAAQDAEARLDGRTPEPRAYRPLNELPDVPYVCLRLPTGGGKTLLATESIRIVGSRYMRRAWPLTLWFVTSDAIKTQTLEALKDRGHAYRRRLDESFGGRVRVFDIDEFETLRPHDIERATCVMVSTIQAFRVADTRGRRVYAHHEELEPHFAGLATEGMEVVSEAEAAGSDMLRAGAVKFSFANLLWHHRPLMIVDEAHNAVSGLSREVQARIRPAAIIEFTATPKGRSNILHSVTASALKAEEMIKLPIRVRPHDDWRAAVSGAVRTQHELEEKAKRGKDFLRPVVLYQAQAKNGHPTVAEVRRHLVEEKLVPEAWIRIATGEQRELDGVDLRDPAVPVRHVITVQALKEGWDCPSAYVLCATQKLTSRTAVEQLLGRVLRMPYAERRRDHALNCAYAHVSEPSFKEAAEGLRDKLIHMGFTDEEVRESLKPRGVEMDAQGRLFDPDTVRPRPVLQFSVADGEEVRARLNGMQDEGVDYVVAADGSLTVGVKGEIADAVARTVTDMVRPSARPALEAEIARHRARIEAGRTLAEKGAVIEAPQLLVEMEGERFVAETDAIMERVAWSLRAEDARLSEAELTFRREEKEIEIDLEGEKLVYSQTTRSEAPFAALGAPADADLEASLVQWLERECRAPDIPQAELMPWIAALVADLLTRRGIDIRTLIDWQHRIATKIRWKLGEIRNDERTRARQMALLDEGAVPTWSPGAVVRFDETVYRGVATQPTGAFRFRKHLHGADRAPLIDGKPDGEEFRCACALDGLDEVEVWVRNVARHADSFWLPRVNRRFYPDFVAKLKDGRIFVVEYKGDDRVGAPEEREKTTIGKLWARTTGNLFITVQEMKHGLDPAAQMRAEIRVVAATVVA